MSSEQPTRQPESAMPDGPPARPEPLPFPVVGVGASAGGMEAFARLLENLPPEPGLAVILVLHLDPHHESLVTSILGRSTPP
jgi:two-component system, chemotaxis family, CheB/CheR fusion protein